MTRGVRVAAAVALGMVLLLAAGCRKKESPAAKGLGEQEQAFVREKLAGMTDSVQLLSFANRDHKVSAEAVHLYDQLAELQGKVTRRSLDFRKDAAEAGRLGVGQAPAVLITKGEETGLRFFGLPDGYEFSVFVDTIRRMSLNQPDVSAKGAVALASLTIPVNLKVFTTPG
jgi:alkyl hydroperoxide reductase subunit AhpF